MIQQIFHFLVLQTHYSKSGSFWSVTSNPPLIWSITANPALFAPSQQVHHLSGPLQQIWLFLVRRTCYSKLGSFWSVVPLAAAAAAASFPFLSFHLSQNSRILSILLVFEQRLFLFICHRATAAPTAIVVASSLDAATSDTMAVVIKNLLAYFTLSLLTFLPFTCCKVDRSLKCESRHCYCCFSVVDKGVGILFLLILFRVRSLALKRII